MYWELISMKKHSISSSIDTTKSDICSSKRSYLTILSMDIHNLELFDLETFNKVKKDFFNLWFLRKPLKRYWFEHHISYWTSLIAKNVQWSKKKKNRFNLYLHHTNVSLKIQNITKNQYFDILDQFWGILRLRFISQIDTQPGTLKLTCASKFRLCAFRVRPDAFDKISRDKTLMACIKMLGLARPTTF